MNVTDIAARVPPTHRGAPPPRATVGAQPPAVVVVHGVGPLTPAVCYAGPRAEVIMSSSIIWAVAGVLLVLWLLGFFVARIGDLVHLLLVLAVIVVAYNFIVGRGRGAGV